MWTVSETHLDILLHSLLKERSAVFLLRKTYKVIKQILLYYKYISISKHLFTPMNGSYLNNADKYNISLPRQIYNKMTFLIGSQIWWDGKTWIVISHQWNVSCPAYYLHVYKTFSLTYDIVWYRLVQQCNLFFTTELSNTVNFAPICLCWWLVFP